MEHPVQWTAPSPTWRALAGAEGTPASPAFRRPALLRFATDTFMEDYTSVLDVDPFRLGEFTAKPETWRGPLTSVQPTEAAPLFARALQRKRFASLRASSSGAAAVAEAPPPGGPAPRPPGPPPPRRPPRPRRCSSCISPRTSATTS